MPTLEEIKQEALELRRRHGWPDKTPEARFLYLVSEVGELSTALQRLVPAHGSTDVSEVDAAVDEVAMELYDVIWNACDLANIVGVDLDDAARRKAAFNCDRQW